MARFKDAAKRAILEAVSLNRLLSDVSLVTVKRKPFDILAKQPSVQQGRGDWYIFEPFADLYVSYTNLILKPPDEDVKMAAYFAMDTMYEGVVFA